MPPPLTTPSYSYAYRIFFLSSLTVVLNCSRWINPCYFVFQSSILLVSRSSGPLFRLVKCGVVRLFWRPGLVITTADRNRKLQDFWKWWIKKNHICLIFSYIWRNNLKCIERKKSNFSFKRFILPPNLLPLWLCCPERPPTPRPHSATFKFSFCPFLVGINIIYFADDHEVYVINCGTSVWNL